MAQESGKDWKTEKLHRYCAPHGLEHVQDVLGDVLGLGQMLVDLPADAPEEVLHLGLVLELEIAELEHGERLFPPLDRVVVALGQVLGVEFLEGLAHLRDRLGLLVRLRQLDGRGPGLDDAHGVDDHQGMVRHDGAAGLGHDVGLRDLLLLADLLDGVDQAVDVLARRVVGGAVHGRVRAVVVHAQAAAAVEVLDVELLLAQLGVDAGAFLDRVLDGLDVGDLGADVEMQELDAVAHARRAKVSTAPRSSARSARTWRCGRSSTSSVPCPGSAAWSAGRSCGRTPISLAALSSRRDLAGLLDDHDDFLAELDAQAGPGASWTRPCSR